MLNNKHQWFLTACSKAEQLLWIGVIPHKVTIAENQVVSGITAHVSQQSESEVSELLWQEHRGCHGTLSQSHFHPGSRGEHHGHICGGRRKHKHT